MKCPFCGVDEDKVVDSRAMSEGISVRRRRECLRCNRRFTTYEYVENIPVMVVKRDQRREPYNRAKVLSGLRKACQKRPISEEQINSVADYVEQKLWSREQKEIPSTLVGELVMNQLRKLDDVAYVRFASVYRQFRDITEFMDELQKIVHGEPKKKKKP